MILKALEERDRRRERKAKTRGELVKVQLNDSKKTTMVGVELIEPMVIKMTESIRENQLEFTWSLADMPGLDPSVAIHKLNFDPNTRKVVQKKKVFSLKR